MALSRRLMLAAGASIIGVAGMPAISFGACDRGLTPTESIDGPPEYVPGAPIRTSLLNDRALGQAIRLYGRALTTTCEPLIGARLDFWHTDSNGIYDMHEYKFRGAQYTDKQGGFRLDTVMPGPYGGPRHVHFLIATRLGNRLQPLMLSAAMFFPTAEEFARAKPSQRTAEFLSPDALRVVGGILMAPCDIVLETS